MCNCKNGSDRTDFVTTVPGGTAADAVYQLGITHFTCGGRKMSVSDITHPVTGELSAQVLGTQQDLENGTFCCEVLLSGTVRYHQCGCCSPRVEYVSLTLCLPCSSLATPTVTIGKVVCSPVSIPYYGSGCCQGVCPGTNKIAITTSINITTP